MKRGEIWTVAGGNDYAGKPRPVVILQDDLFDATTSVTVCPLTTNRTQAPLFRIEIWPHPENGLHSRSHLMVDKITTVSRAKLGSRVGLLNDEDMVQLNRAVILFLNLLETA